MTVNGRSDDDAGADAGSDEDDRRDGGESGSDDVHDGGSCVEFGWSGVDQTMMPGPTLVAMRMTEQIEARAVARMFMGKVLSISV
jgi:hypothetical protein